MDIFPLFAPSLWDYRPQNVDSKATVDLKLISWAEKFSFLYESGDMEIGRFSQGLVDKVVLGQGILALYIFGPSDQMIAS